MHLDFDGKGQRYVEWLIAPGVYKRAWIQRRTGSADWAGTGRYLNVVRVEAPRTGPRGQAADFPVFYTEEDADDDSILLDFVRRLCAAVGNTHP
ncbi:hypothetical protein [uncultured Sphingomonas sp.]|uniref:hypothetical protein n=1 Tax=uncultured Sphingomonas sp. TaxID=158754 RepID=UPI0025DCD088|nr:hypothetical protein [uncultured Sphingomonas sp.]